jgi:hypothetical protein
MFKVCAIMSVYNEEDIIYEAVTKLINGGVDVYVINNGSTDQTIEKIKYLVGKGVIDIFNFETKEDGKRVFKLSSILEQVELIAKKLQYDWFLHVDADEIRYSPWLNYSLNEGIERVDFEGFNLINFKLYNFRTTIDYEFSHDYENSMQFFTESDKHSNIQIKGWRKNNEVSLSKYGGHIVQCDNPQLYPLQFIHKHYPIRGINHGHKKLKCERLGNYSQEEVNRGWHKHYEDVDFNTLKGIVWEYSQLQKFSIEKELLKIHSENNKKMLPLIRLRNYETAEELDVVILKMIKKSYYLSDEEAVDRLKIAKIMINQALYGDRKKIISSRADEKIFNQIFDVYAVKNYLNSQPIHERLINQIKFN